MRQKEAAQRQLFILACFPGSVAFYAYPDREDQFSSVDSEKERVVGGVPVRRCAANKRPEVRAVESNETGKCPGCLSFQAVAGEALREAAAKDPLRQ